MQRRSLGLDRRPRPGFRGASQVPLIETWVGKPHPICFTALGSCLVFLVLVFGFCSFLLGVCKKQSVFCYHTKSRDGTSPKGLEGTLGVLHKLLRTIPVGGGDCRMIGPRSEDKFGGKCRASQVLCVTWSPVSEALGIGGPGRPICPQGHLPFIYLGRMNPMFSDLLQV